MQFGSEEQERYKYDELAAADALLLGRTTYEGFAAAWPGMMDQYEGPRRAELGEYADMMNGYPKHVASTTLGAARGHCAYQPQTRACPSRAGCELRRTPF